MSIPKGWEEVRLGDICSDVIGGGTPSTKNSKFWQGDIPWISSSDLIDESIYHIDTTRFITQEAIDKSATKLIPKNSVIVVTRVGLGKLAINDKELCTSQDFQSLIFKNQNYLFMAYAIKHNIYDTIKIMQGTSIKGITKEQLKSMKIKLPPLKEQEKIAEILSSCDEHIKNLKNLKSELEKEKLHLMNELLSGKTRFANFTTPWQEVKLGEIGKFYRGLSYKRENVTDDGLLVLRSNNIQNNRIEYNDLQFVNIDCKDELSLRNGHIVICMANGSKNLVGKSAEFIDNGSYTKTTVGAFLVFIGRSAK